MSSTLQACRCTQSISRTVNRLNTRSIAQYAIHSINYSAIDSLKHLRISQSINRHFSKQSDAAALIGMSLIPQKTNQSMWDSIVKVGLLTDELAISCVKKVDRRLFVNQSNNQSIYDPNASLPIGSGATVATPVSQARAIQSIAHMFQRSERVRVLDLGSGCGYVTHVLSLMAGERGWAVGLEHSNELVQSSERLARRHFPQLIDQGRIQFIQRDARIGFEKKAPYDLIHSGIAFEEVPQQLIDQLAPEGLALLPLVQADGQSQELILIEKRADGSINQSSLGSCGYSRVRNAPPPAGHDSIDAFKAETQQLVSQMKVMETSIKQWRLSRSGPITLKDFEADDVMSATLKNYSLIRKKVEARLRVEAQQTQ